MESSQGPRDYMGGGADASPLAQVHEGLSVYDASGDDIGSVAEVRMADTEAADLQPADANTSGQVDSVLDSAADAIAGGTEDASTRLMSTGYFKLDSKGLFAGDKYVTPDLIASVDADGVRLNVEKDAIPDPA